ncbi:MAG: DUF1015 domain-containing protein [Anaerotruncus sp.]|nr:DUF1015 domain-containing protein [Anaerotruncus sp.]
MARIEPFRGVRPRQDLAAPRRRPALRRPVVGRSPGAGGREPLFLPPRRQAGDRPAARDRPLLATPSTPRARRTSTASSAKGRSPRTGTRNFYIYKQIWGDHVQIGLVAAASCQDYLDDVIKKHELTRVDKENDRMRHIETLGAQTGPVFLTYRQVGRGRRPRRRGHGPGARDRHHDLRRRPPHLLRRRRPGTRRPDQGRLRRPGRRSTSPTATTAPPPRPGSRSSGTASAPAGPGTRRTISSWPSSSPTAR